MAREPDHFRLTLNWDDVNKRWRMAYVVQTGRGVASHWRWIETHEPIDAGGAAAIAQAVAQELASWLPFAPF
jgi:hypothetical protein